jgi:hypothetical protein
VALQPEALSSRKTGQPMKSEESDMDLYVIRRPSAWANLEELQATGEQSARIGNEQMSERVRWIRSYVVHEPDGRIGTFCLYEARNGESIREHARRVGMPGDEFYKVATTVVVRSDPSAPRVAAE